MLSDIEIKNLKIVNDILEDFRTSMSQAEKNLKEIDEKYKAIIDKEKKEYKQTIASCKKEIDFWEKPLLKRYGKTIAELLAKPEEAQEDTDESVDTNDDLPFEDDEKVVDEQEEVVEETAEETAPEFDGAGFTEEDNIVTEENAEDDNWDDESEEKKDDNGGWGDFPAEWK